MARLRLSKRQGNLNAKTLEKIMNKNGGGILRITNVSGKATLRLSIVDKNGAEVGSLGPEMALNSGDTINVDAIASIFTFTYTDA